LTAGGFVYLAATTLLPEILDDTRSTGKFRLAQLAAFIAGIGFLYTPISYRSWHSDRNSLTWGRILT
jgi:zinc transporter ZupT